MPGPLEASLDQLREAQILAEQPFRSQVPLLGPLISWLRTRWNNVSTVWYVRPLIAQQNRFNSRVVEHLAAQNARVDRVEARTDDFEARLQIAETRVYERVAPIEELLDRLHDHDAWLIARDQEQSGYVRDLAEVTLQLIQLKRRLQELERGNPTGLAGQGPAEHSE